MKNVTRQVLLAGLLSAPLFAIAQSNAPVTQAEVKSQLSSLEAAGYKPANDDPNYPANLQVAEERVLNQSAIQKQNDGYGGSAARSSQSGTRRALPGDRNSIYFGD